MNKVFCSPPKTYSDAPYHRVIILLRDANLERAIGLLSVRLPGYR